MTAPQSALENPPITQKNAAAFVDTFIGQPDSPAVYGFDPQGLTALTIQVKTQFNYMHRNNISKDQNTYRSDDGNIICIVNMTPSKDEDESGKEPKSLLFLDLCQNAQFMVGNENGLCMRTKMQPIDDPKLIKVIGDLSL